MEGSFVCVWGGGGATRVQCINKMTNILVNCWMWKSPTEKNQIERQRRTEKTCHLLVYIICPHESNWDHSNELLMTYPWRVSYYLLCHLFLQGRLLWLWKRWGSFPLTLQFHGWTHWFKWECTIHSSRTPSNTPSLSGWSILRRRHEKNPSL